MALGAVVLAAGASTRMGRPKALIRWRDRTFVEHAIAAALAAGCSPIVVVDGAHPLPHGELPPDVTTVTNADWNAGQLSSLQVGAREILAAHDPSGVLVLTVDRPHIEHETVRRLTEAHAREPAAIWQPAHEGQRGHPIVYPRAVVDVLLELPPQASARELLARTDVAALRRTVDVDDAAVLDNIDRPHDLARLDAVRR